MGASAWHNRELRRVTLESDKEKRRASSPAVVSCHTTIDGLIIPSKIFRRKTETFCRFTAFPYFSVNSSVFYRLRGMRTKLAPRIRTHKGRHDRFQISRHCRCAVSGTRSPRFCCTVCSQRTKIKIGEDNAFCLTRADQFHVPRSICIKRHSIIRDGVSILSRRGIVRQRDSAHILECPGTHCAWSIDSMSHALGTRINSAPWSISTRHFWETRGHNKSWHPRAPYPPPFPIPRRKILHPASTPLPNQNRRYALWRMLNKISPRRLIERHAVTWGKRPFFEIRQPQSPSPARMPAPGNALQTDHCGRWLARTIFRPRVRFI